MCEHVAAVSYNNGSHRRLERHGSSGLISISRGSVLVVLHLFKNPQFAANPRDAKLLSGPYVLVHCFE